MRDIEPSDFIPMGEAETIVDCAYDVLYGLVVPKTYGGTLGLLAIKCERVGSSEWPVSLAIADTPIAIDTHVLRAQQSNPRRWIDGEDGA